MRCDTLFQSLGSSLFTATGQNHQWAKTNFLTVPITYLTVKCVQLFIEDLNPMTALWMAAASAVADLFAGTINANTNTPSSNGFRHIASSVYPLTAAAILSVPLLPALAYTALIIAIRIFIAANSAKGQTP